MNSYRAGFRLGYLQAGPKEAEMECLELGFFGDDYDLFWDGYYDAQTNEDAGFA